MPSRVIILPCNRDWPSCTPQDIWCYSRVIYSTTSSMTTEESSAPPHNWPFEVTFLNQEPRRLREGFSYQQSTDGTVSLVRNNTSSDSIILNSGPPHGLFANPFATVKIIPEEHKKSMLYMGLGIIDEKSNREYLSRIIRFCIGCFNLIPFFFNLSWKFFFNLFKSFKV